MNELEKLEEDFKIGLEKFKNIKPFREIWMLVDHIELCIGEDVANKIYSRHDGWTKHGFTEYYVGLSTGHRLATDNENHIKYVVAELLKEYEKIK